MKATKAPSSRKTLYNQAADLILERQIKGRPAGLRLPSEREMSDVLGVSMITTRAALKELENRGWIERRQGSGTYIADRLPTQKHVAVLLESSISDPFLSPYYPAVFQEVRLALLKMGIPNRPYLGYLKLGVEIGELTCRDVLDDLKLNRLSGLISLLGRKHRSWVPEFRKRRIPVVGRALTSDTVVEADHEQAARLTCAYLREKGCRRPAVMGKELREQKEHSLIGRFREMAPEYGLELERAHIQNDAGGLIKREGANGMAEILDRSKVLPDAVFISNDVLFADAYAVLEERGLAGSIEVVIFGSDAMPIPCRPKVSRCIHKVSDSGLKMAETMRRCLEGEEVRGETIPVSFLPAEQRLLTE